MTLKILILGCLITVSCVAAHRGGPGGGGGFHGGGMGAGGFHGGGGHGHGGHGFGDRRGPGHGPGHWGGGHGGGGHRGPDWRPDGDHHHHEQPHKPEQPKPHQPDPKPDPKQDPKPNPTPQPEPNKPDQHKSCPPVNFIVHEPQGLEVWIIQELDITLFGVELYVNKHAGAAGISCDLCANTTDITYGKFFIENTDVLVKKGDSLSYFAWIGKGQQFHRCDVQTIVVTPSIITECDCGTSDIQDIDIRFNGEEKRTEREAIYVRKGGDQAIFKTTEATDPEVIQKEYREDMINECDIDPKSASCPSSKAEAKANRMGKDPQREIEILEEIVEHMKVGCAGQVTNQLVLLKQAPFAANGDGDLMEFVKAYFGISAEFQSLGEEILRVIPVHPGVGQGVVFEMENYADKQRVLYHARLNDLRQIVDYDHAHNSY